MRLAAAALSAVFVYFAVGYLTGNGPQIEFRSGRKQQISPRQLWLQQAGVELSPAQFWLVSLGMGFLAFLLLLLITGIPMVALVPAVGLAFLPRFYFARQRAVRLAEVQKAWPDGLRDLTASINAGMSLPRAIEALANKGPDPLRRAFERFSLLSRTVGVVPALEIIKEEVADATSDRVIEVLILAYERGGNIVPEILNDLADATTQDLWTIEEIQSEALEQRINARIVFVLPWFVLIVLTMFQGQYATFYRSTMGGLVILAGAALSLFGIWLVGRLIAEPPERRVLGGAATVQDGERV